jgi:hypothetical protein
MIDPIISAAGFAEIFDNSLPGPFDPFLGVFVFGIAGAIVCTISVLFMYRSDIRRLTISFEFIVFLLSCRSIWFFSGAAFSCML